MRKNFFRKIIVFFCVLICLMLTLCITNYAFADETEIVIQGTRYYFDGNDHYELTNYSGTTTTDSTENYGEFIINGDIMETSAVDDYVSYEILNGNVTFSYNIDSSKLNLEEEQWNVVEDKSKKVDTLTLEDNVMNGAVIVQASIDGEHWVNESEICNIFSDQSLTQEFYTTKDIQQYNGCYFRVLIAYRLGRKIGDGLFGTSKFEYAKYVEEYKFYVVDNEAVSNLATKPDDTPCHIWDNRISTGKDNGFSGNEAIDIKDPHYGWNIGQFFINGYTRETVDSSTGSTVFLKNVGDTVVLWFNLQQDIYCLNGDANLQISEDINGYDQLFEIDKTNFKHGTLLIRYTDYEGKVHDPIIYTDYLAANARTGANTRVELFEEGNYEVALDYEIVDKSGIDSYTNYRMFFTFEIRNGNCMVYPFDVMNGTELRDNSWTANGFKLDMARSRYLSIDIQRISVGVDGNGFVYQDSRVNEPTKDGASYTKEGIYVFTVKNIYADLVTTKSIFVGENKYLAALAKNNLTVEQLNEYIRNGYDISNIGVLIEPKIEDVEETIESVSADFAEESVSENTIEDDVFDDKDEGNADDANCDSTSSEEGDLVIARDVENDLDSISTDSISMNGIEGADSDNLSRNESGFVKVAMLLIVCIFGVGCVFKVIRTNKKNEKQ